MNAITRGPRAIHPPGSLQHAEVDGEGDPESEDVRIASVGRLSVIYFANRALHHPFRPGRHLDRLATRAERTGPDIAAAGAGACRMLAAPDRIGHRRLWRGRNFGTMVAAAQRGSVRGSTGIGGHGVERLPHELVGGAGLFDQAVEEVGEQPEHEVVYQGLWRWGRPELVPSYADRLRLHPARQGRPRGPRRLYLRPAAGAPGPRPGSRPVTAQLHKAAHGPLEVLRARTLPEDRVGGPTFAGAQITADANLVVAGLLLDF